MKEDIIKTQKYYKGVKNGYEYKHPVICINCGKKYYIPNYRIKNKRHRLCSAKCRGIFFSNEDNNYLCGRIGIKNPNWKGGHTSHGYKIVEKRQLEHRKIIEEFLGRKLLKNEIVHHKDLNRSNNSIENLKLMSGKEHAEFHKQLTINALNYIKEKDYDMYIEIINGN